MRLQEVKMGTNVLRKVLTHHGDKVVAGFEAEVIIPREDSTDDADVHRFETWSDVHNYLNLNQNQDNYPTRLKHDYDEWMYEQAHAIITSDRDEFERQYPSEDYDTPEEWLDAVTVDVMADYAYEEDFWFWKFMLESGWSGFFEMMRDYHLGPLDFDRSEFDQDVANSASNIPDSVYDEASQWESIVGMDVQVSEYVEEDKEHDRWYFEPDSSIVPDDAFAAYGQEIVSPPLALREMLGSLEEFYSFSKSRGYRTNSSTGLHIGISVPDMAKMDLTKFILFLGDEYILRKFEREANEYAKSMSSSLLDEISQVSNVPPSHQEARVDLIRQWLNSPKLHELATEVITEYMSRTKYASINITHTGYLEIRSPGGDWLNQFQEVYVTVLRIAKVILLATDKNAAKQEYARKLTKFFDHLKPTLLSVLPKPAPEEPELLPSGKRKARPEFPPKRLPR